MKQPNNKMNRRLIRRLAIAFFVLAILLVPLMVLVSRTSWGTEYVRGQLEQVIRKELGLVAKIPSLHIDFHPTHLQPSLSALDVELLDPIHGEFAQIGSIQITPSIWNLLRGKIDIRSIDLNQATFKLQIRDGKIVNLPLMHFKEQEPAAIPQIPVQEFIASNTNIEIDAEPFGKVILQGIGIRMDRSSHRQSMNFQIHAGGGQVIHPYGTENISMVSLRGEVGIGTFLRVSNLQIQTTRLALELQDVFVPLPVGEGWRGSAMLSLNLEDLQHLVPSTLQLPALQGLAEITLKAEDQKPSPHLSGQIKLSKASVANKGLGDELLLNLTYIPGKILIESGHMAIHDAGGKANLKGEVKLDSKMSVHVMGKIVNLQFAKLMEQLNISKAPLVAWKFNGNFNIKGSLFPFSLKGPANFQTKDFLLTQEGWRKKKNQRIIGVDATKLKTQVRINPEYIAFENIVGKLPHSDLSANVRLGFDEKFKIDGAIDPLDFKDGSPLITFPMNGKGKAEIHISGTYGKPKIEGKIQANNFVFSDFPIGQIESDAVIDVNSTTVVFPDLQVRKKKSRYSVKNFSIDLSNNAVGMTGDFDASQLYLRDLLHTLDLDQEPNLTSFDGLVVGHARIDYSKGKVTDSPLGTLNIFADFQIPDLSVYDHKFSSGKLIGHWNWVDPQASVEGGNLTLNHLSFKKEQGTVWLSGQMKTGGQLNLSLAADRIEFSDTEIVKMNLPKLGGLYSLLGSVSGTLEDPRVKLDASIVSTTWAGDLLGDGRLYIRRTSQRDPWIQQADLWDPANPPSEESCAYARSGLSQANWLHPKKRKSVNDSTSSAWIICGNLFEQNIEVDFVLGDSPAFPLRGKVSLVDFSLFPFLPKISETNLLQGNVSADLLILDGDIFDPSTLSAELSIPEIFLQNGDAFLQNTQPIKITSRNGQFNIEQLEIEGERTKLQLTGQGHVEEDLNLSILGEIDLSLLATFSNLVQQSEGTAMVDFKVRGALNDPQLYGKAEIKNGTFGFSGFLEPIERLKGTISLEQRRVLFQDFEASVAGGTMTLDGAAFLQNGKLSQYQLDTLISNVNLEPESGVHLNFNGRASLNWNREMRIPVLKGNLRLNNFLYERPFSLSPTLDQLSQPKRVKVKQYNPKNDFLQIDLQIDSNAPLQISNNLLDAELRIENRKQPFRIVGTDQRFGFLGSVSVDRGTLRFQDTIFELNQGIVEFRDPTQINPYLDVEGVASIRRVSDVTAPNWRINLRMYGDGDNLKVDASSDPELPMDDILLLLTIGMTRSEVAQLQAGSVTGSAALEALAAVTGIGNEVSRRVSLIDDFSISSVYSSETNQTEPVISIGKRLTEKIRVTASTGLSSENRNFRTGLEWKIGKRTNVQAVYDNMETQTNSSVGNIGVDLRWRLDFD